MLIVGAIATITMPGPNHPYHIYKVCRTVVKMLLLFRNQGVVGMNYMHLSLGTPPSNHDYTLRPHHIHIHIHLSSSSCLRLSYGRQQIRGFFPLSTRRLGQQFLDFGCGLSIVPSSTFGISSGNTCAVWRRRFFQMASDMT